MAEKAGEFTADASLGGMIALAMLARAPQMVKGISITLCVSRPSAVDESQCSKICEMFESGLRTHQLVKSPEGPEPAPLLARTTRD